VVDEPESDWADETFLLAILMRLDAKLDRILELMEDEFGEEEEEPDA
jgi:hypothetical protein